MASKAGAGNDQRVNLSKRRRDVVYNCNGEILKQLEAASIDEMSHVIVRLDSRNITVTNHRLSDRLNVKQKLLIETLQEFYSVPENLNALDMAIGNNCCISLRVLDWLTTNYAKSKSVFIDNGCATGTHFNLYSEYKSCLKAYQKRSFDPFARRDRIVFQVNNVKLITTPGQLNFFRWAIKNNVLKYALDNYGEIEDHMVQCTKKKVKHKHRNLTKHALKSNLKL